MRLSAPVAICLILTQSHFFSRTLAGSEQTSQQPRDTVNIRASQGDPSNKLSAGAMHSSGRARRASHHRHRLQATVSVEGRVACGSQHLLTQSGHLAGAWVVHEDPHFQSYYGNMSNCPAFARDFDCLMGSGPKEHHNSEQARLEFRKVFRPDECDMRPFTDTAFDEQLAGRRLIMIGDSNMNGMFTSIGCLMQHRSEGQLLVWNNPSNTMTQVKGKYADSDGREILLQTTGQIKLSKGGRILLRCFGRYSLQLWDDVMKELEPITDRDILFVNWGAWYHRFYFAGGPEEYNRWRIDMNELVIQRLSGLKAQIIWKGYTTFHYAGETGAFTGVQQELPDHITPLQSCQPTTVGEFWFDEFMSKTMGECGKPCANMSVLPLFEASLPQHNAHHGAYGRGRADGEVDCTHYCHNVLDQWVTFLYNALVPAEGPVAPLKQLQVSISASQQ